jgi:hypothetical protein
VSSSIQVVPGCQVTLTQPTALLDPNMFGQPQVSVMKYCKDLSLVRQVSDWRADDRLPVPTACLPPPAQQSAAPTFSFGAASTAPKPSLFGAPAAQSSPAPSLFGSTSTAPAPSSSPFGQPQQQQQQAPSTSLFGQSQPAPAAGGGLFGGGAFGAAKPAAPTSGGGLFGGGGFGAQQQQQQQPQQQQQQQQQTFQPGQSQQPSAQNGAIGPKTKFTDLPEAAQKIVEGIE